MSDIKDLLDLIEKNDAVTILSQENIVERLNVLFKYEIILFTEGQISISPKGKKFQDKEENFSPLVTSFSEQTYLED